MAKRETKTENKGNDTKQSCHDIRREEKQRETKSKRKTWA